MIAYPVSPTSRWAIYRLSTASVIEIHKPWPRADGGPIERPDPDVVPLLMVQAALPVFNLATEELVKAAPVVNVSANTYTQGYTVIPLTAEKLAFIAEGNTKAQELAQIKALYTDLKNGVGTSAVRIARCERVLARILKDLYAQDMPR